MNWKRPLGEPTAVILDIGEYQEMLERLEDMEDLKMLEKWHLRCSILRPLKTRDGVPGPATLFT